MIHWSGPFLLDVVLNLDDCAQVYGLACATVCAVFFVRVLIHTLVLSLWITLQLTALVDCCVVLLERPDLLPSPLAQTRIVELLLTFLDTSERSSRRLGAGWGSSVHSQLASIVHACPAVQEHLGPALLHTYAAVDVIEGLDVDKENFDKFGARQVFFVHISCGSCRKNLTWCQPDIGC